MATSFTSSAHDRPLLAFKFGGTSVGSVERFRTVIRVVTKAARSARVFVVNSALSHVTRQLDAGLDAILAAEEPPAAVADALLATLRARHREQAAVVLSSTSQMQYASMVEQRLARLRYVLDQAAAEGASFALRDELLATGEQLAVPMVALALHDVGLAVAHGDATQLLRTDATFGGAAVDINTTRATLRHWADALPPTTVPVMAGFIGGTADGETTTLGFEGSDYSAALVASILNADRLTRYTDVNGLYTKDPRTHDDAVPIEELAMKAAFARTEAGELGMHPKTLRPLVEADIALHIRSIDAPDAPGTRIIPEAQLVATGTA